MSEPSGTSETTEMEEELPDAREAYDAFNVLWSEVQRHIRAKPENQQRMRIVRAYFDHEIAQAAERSDIERRAALAEVVGAALALNAPSRASEEVEADEVPTMLHLTLRALRVLTRREWEMAKAIVDIHHRFDAEDLREIVDELHGMHCVHCGEWLDDDDEHENCSGTSEDTEEEDDDGDSSSNGSSMAMSSPGVAAAPIPVEVVRSIACAAGCGREATQDVNGTLVCETCAPSEGCIHRSVVWKKGESMATCGSPTCPGHRLPDSMVLLNQEWSATVGRGQLQFLVP